MKSEIQLLDGEVAARITKRGALSIQTTMAKILLLEDDPDVALVVSESLSIDRHEVTHCATGSQALLVLSEFEFDVLILDWVLPDISGMEILGRFRARGGVTPALFLTSKDSIDEKVTGFDRGADDYLTKPFHPKELCARVRALLRRFAGHATDTLKVGTIELDPIAYRVQCEGREVNLAPREFALLEFLMRHPNQAFSADDLLTRVWSSDSDAGPETVRTCVKRLRQKLGIDCKDSILQTLPRVGYKLLS